MGWSIGDDSKWKRHLGYGVPAFCDHAGCGAEIDRGLGYKCEDEDCGCGKFYCTEHRYDTTAHTHEAPPDREHPMWAMHVLTDESWAAWRAENPDRVAFLANQGEGASR